MNPIRRIARSSLAMTIAGILAVLAAVGVCEILDAGTDETLNAVGVVLLALALARSFVK